MLRVGKRAIVAFPNFGHYSVRLSTLWSGRAPRTTLFPYEWYDSPNIHFLTVLDFETLAAREKLAGGKAHLHRRQDAGDQFPEPDGGGRGVSGLSAARIEIATEVIPHTLTVEETDAAKRLDHFLQEQLPQYSRSRLQSLVKDGLVTIDGVEARVSHLLHGGEHIEVHPAELPPLKATPEDEPIEVLYEDDAVLAINKPAGLVVHAGAGNHTGTLVNRLLHRFQNAIASRRRFAAGDRASAGQGYQRCLLVARTDAAHRALSAQFAGRNGREDISCVSTWTRDATTRAV